MIANIAILPISATPAQSLELFGFNIFGGDDEEEIQVEVINPKPYRVRFEISSGDSDLQRRIRQSSILWTEREQPASGVAGLVSEARGDYRGILAALYSEGYYSGAISILVDGQEAATRPLTEPLPDETLVVIRVDPGPPFRFGKTGFQNPPPWVGDVVPRDAREQFQTGQPARAEIVNAAGDEATEAWRHAGYPKARVASRDVTADHATRRLDAQINIDPGREARFGETSVDIPRRVVPQFIRYMADIPEREKYDPKVLEKSQNRLARLGVFRAVRIVEAEEIEPDGTLPVTVEALHRPPRRIGFGATFSSIDGLGLEAYWLHRNLFKRAERLRFDASVSNIGEESSYEDYGYLLGVSFAKPGVISPDTNLELGLKAEQNVFDTYRERTVDASVGLSRIFTDRITGSVFASLAFSEIKDDAGTREFLTASVPVSLTYDSRDNDLDPTEGWYLSEQVQPFHELEFGSTGVRSVSEARTYFGFNDDRTILAFRAEYGTIVGGDRDELPPTMLFFTGGGGSVRGYPYKSNGLDVDGEIVGARSAVEVSAEVRQKITDRFGIVGFVDGGLVSDEVFPGGDTDMKVGVGAGVRYYSGLGPLRLDIGVPLDRNPGDSSWALYIGIGQAF